MSLNELKSKIIKDAEIQARSIEQEAEAEKEKILKECENQIKAMQAELEKEADRLAEEKYQNIVTLARVESRNETLAVKRNLIDKVFEAVMEKMHDMKPDEFRLFAEKLLLKHPPASKDTKLLVGRKSRSLVDSGFIEKINSRIKSGNNFILSQENREFDYGFYIVTEWIEIDLSFDGILKSLREDLEMQVIETLFGKG